MFGLVNSFWISLWNYILHVFSLFSRVFVEKSVENWGENDDHGVKSEEEVKEIKGFDEIEEKEMENVVNANTSKYQFFAGNSVCAFVEEPQITTMNFTVHEMFVFSDHGFSPKLDFVEKVDPFFDREIKGFDVDSVNHHDVVETSVFDVLSREGEVAKHVEIGNLGCDDLISREDDGVVKHVEIGNLGCDDGVVKHVEIGNLGCDDLSSREEDGVVVKHVEIGNLGCDDPSSREDGVVKHVKIENLGCGDQILVHDDCDDLVSRDDEVVKHDESGNLGCDDLGSREDEVVEQKISEIHDVCELNFDEKDGSSVVQDVVFEKGETIILDEVSNHQVRSSNSNSDDFWSTIYEHDFGFGSHEEIMVDSEEYPLKSLDDSSIDQNSSSLDDDDDDDESEDEEEFDSSFIELDPHTTHTTTSTINTQKQALDALDEVDDEFSDSDESDEESCEEGGGGRGVQVGNDDVLLEQRELIRQMKREMRQLKVSGLPTILEESESPRVEDDLRPLRIDDRIRHKDRMDEIQIFYKRYLDMMRKLDISSQQTMYAIGLLQLKSQDPFDLNKKASVVPVMKSVLAQNFWTHKLRKHEADHVKKLIRDLKRELELVYVGQLCLSWEILKWQYRKVEELQTHDPDGFRQYNQVAGEFQKFQVLLQRFTEDEPFDHGPRVQYFLKSRCSLSNLLQVPLIKDDQRNELRGDREGAISISMLKEVIMSSMRSFWDFVRSDKDEVHAINLMGIHAPHVDLQNPSDTDLLTEIRTSLHKKEKRLKDLIKSGNCLVRKFQKHQEPRLSPEMFLAQVELRVVSRVLNMSKLTTDQILWTHKKINRINIIGRKVHIESSFLLFPF